MFEFGLEFSMTTWGSPDAPKRALLVHGLQGVGQVFFKVAKILVANGEPLSPSSEICTDTGEQR